MSLDCARLFDQSASCGPGSRSFCPDISVLNSSLPRCSIPSKCSPHSPPGCWPYYSLLYSKSSSLVYSPGLGYYVSMSPFPLLAPLNILPFTTTSFPPLCSSTVCWIPASLSIDPKGPSLKASHRAWLCVLSLSSCSGDIPSVNVTVSVQEDAVHGCL